MKNGWHKLVGNVVFVEDNKVMRGVFGGTTVYPYRWINKYNTWCKEYMSPAAFSAGVRRGTVQML